MSNQIHPSKGIELIRQFAANGQLIFTSVQAKQMAPTVGIASNYLHQTLHYLQRAGWVIRLKNGLYSLSSSVPGVSPLHEFQIAMALVQPAAISHWSALSYHHLTEQVPRQVFVLTTAQSLPRKRGIQAQENSTGYAVENIIYQFVRIKPEFFFGIEEVWINDSKIKITDPERTMLDCLMSPRYCGGFAEVLYIFEERLSQLNLDKLINYAIQLDTTTIKRLGWILENQGINSSQLELLQKVPIKGYRLLNPTGPCRGSYNTHWMIQENLPEE